MRSRIFDVSGKVDSNTVKLFTIINEISKESSITFFIIGAFAKELLLNYYHEIRTSRYTEDIDICIAVNNWQDYNRFTQRLIEKGGVQFDKVEHKIYFEQYARQLDILPYGFKEMGKIEWPKSGKLMEIEVYNLVKERNITVRVDHSPEVLVETCSLVGLFIIKLTIWHKMRSDRSKDAIDLFEIMANYYFTQKADRYFDEEIFDKVSTDSFDELLVGCFMLGKDIASQFPSSLVANVISMIVENIEEDEKSNLITIIAAENRFRDFEREYLVVKAAFLQLLSAIKSIYEAK